MALHNKLRFPAETTATQEDTNFDDLFGEDAFDFHPEHMNESLEEGAEEEPEGSIWSQLQQDHQRIQQWEEQGGMWL